jgi:hypothetical protein
MAHSYWEEEAESQLNFGQAPEALARTYPTLPYIRYASYALLHYNCMEIEPRPTGAASGQFSKNCRTPLISLAAVWTLPQRRITALLKL